MSLVPEVASAVKELQEAYPNATVTAVPDGSGGAFVTVDPVDVSSRYAPSRTWIKFHITFQYPLADVYPHFVRPDLRRADGQTPGGLPLGPGSSPGAFTMNGVQEPAIQLSRRSNNLNPAVDTAVLKLEKVLEWLKGL